MDHDRLFKELLGTFFLEFVDLFLPDVSKYLDRASPIMPMSQELYRDLTAGEKHTVDLLMRVKVRVEDAYFLIHNNVGGKCHLDVTGECYPVCLGRPR